MNCEMCDITGSEPAPDNTAGVGCSDDACRAGSVNTSLERLAQLEVLKRHAPSADETRTRRTKGRAELITMNDGSLTRSWPGRLMSGIWAGASKHHQATSSSERDPRSSRARGRWPRELNFCRQIHGQLPVSATWFRNSWADAIPVSFATSRRDVTTFNGEANPEAFATGPTSALNRNYGAPPMRLAPTWTPPSTTAVGDRHAWSVYGPGGKSRSHAVELVSIGGNWLDFSG